MIEIRLKKSNKINQDFIYLVKGKQKLLVAECPNAISLLHDLKELVAVHQNHFKEFSDSEVFSFMQKYGGNIKQKIKMIKDVYENRMNSENYDIQAFLTRMNGNEDRVNEIRNLNPLYDGHLTKPLPTISTHSQRGVDWWYDYYFKKTVPTKRNYKGQIVPDRERMIDAIISKIFKNERRQHGI